MQNRVRGPNGGPRPGSGRPPGSKSKHVIERELMAELGRKLMRTSKRTPLEVMLARMDGDATVTDEMFAAAAAAAPFVHPRLAAVESTVKSDNVHRVLSDRPMSAEEWLEKHAPATPPANDSVIDAVEDDGEQNEANS